MRSPVTTEPQSHPRSARPTGATVAQLRAEIDRGRTGGKIAAIDHAAAPLGTDEEAAGTPVPPHVVAEAIRLECRSVGGSAHGASTTAAYRLWIAFGIIIGLAAMAVLAWLEAPWWHRPP